MQHLVFKNGVEQTFQRKIEEEKRKSAISTINTIAFPDEFLDPRDQQTRGRAEPAEQTETIKLTVNDDQKTTKIGGKLANERDQLVNFLKQNIDIFVWSPSDMPGIDRKAITHRLNIDPKSTPIKQKKR